MLYSFPSLYWVEYVSIVPVHMLASLGVISGTGTSSTSMIIASDARHPVAPVCSTSVRWKIPVSPPNSMLVEWLPGVTIVPPLAPSQDQVQVLPVSLNWPLAMARLPFMVISRWISSDVSGSDTRWWKVFVPFPERGIFIFTIRRRCWGCGTGDRFRVFYILLCLKRVRGLFRDHSLHRLLCRLWYRCTRLAGRGDSTGVNRE